MNKIIYGTPPISFCPYISSLMFHFFSSAGPAISRAEASMWTRGVSQSVSNLNKAKGS